MKLDFRKRVLIATPLISVFLFLGIGFFTGKWNYAWIVFFLIPMMPFILGLKTIKLTFPALVTFTYLIIGFIWNLWHPGWIIFLLIPIYSILFPPKLTVKIWRNKTIFTDDDDNIID